MPSKHPSHFFLGLDLGHQQDHSALIALESSTIVYDHRDPVSFEFITEKILSLRHIHRFPLRTPYTAVSEHVRDLIRQPTFHGQSSLIVDAGGPGLPVYDLLKTFHLPASLFPVMITAGDRVTKQHPFWRIPRRILLSNLHTLIYTRALTIAGEIRHARTLLKELSSLRLHLAPTGYESFEPARSSQHDDLVIATALAAYFATHVKSHLRRTGPLPGFHPDPLGLLA